MKNLHVPMPSELHTRLREESQRLGKPATAIAREGIERYLQHLRREAIGAAMTEYARQVAGTHDDLDPELEAAGVEHLLAES